MILHTREFTLEDGTGVIMGKDRETGKRYFCKEITDQEISFEWLPSMYIDTLAKIAKIKAIFWIK